MRLVSNIESPPWLRSGFPYNGLWRMVADKANKVGYFSDADGKETAATIDPLPVNYSCGKTRDSLCILERGAHIVKGLDGRTGRTRWTYEVKDERVNGLWVTPNGGTVLALAGDVDLIALDAHTGNLRATLGGHSIRISNISFTRDGSGLFSCGVDGRVILWDLKTLKVVMQFRGNAAQKMSSADLSPDGTRVATCNFTGFWQLWDATTGTQLMDIHSSALLLRSVILTSDGTGLLTAGGDLQIRRWGSLAEDRSVRISVPAEVLKGIKR